MTLHNATYLLFEQSAKLYPDDCCVISEQTHFTYKQIEEKVSQVYHSILKHSNNEYIIGLSTSRGIEQLIFMLAILKAGKAYLPIDFNYPKSRIQNIIKNSNLNVCLTTKDEARKAEEVGLSTVTDGNLKTVINTRQQTLMSENAAYILYTSGSTGVPKGVCMGQQATVNLINWQNKNSEAKRGSRTLQFAPLSFDVSFQEIMATLSSGGSLVLINDNLRLDMVALLKLIEQHAVNRLFLPFVALQALAEAAVSIQLFPNSLKEIITAGEQLKITTQIRAFFAALNSCKLYNQYGPTECHVVSELKLKGNPTTWEDLPTIGKPIDNTSIYILDKKQQIVPNGQIGELCIAGLCLAEGYLGNENLTKEKFLFIKLPDSKRIRIYRTGDKARYLPDGNIEFLGREDDQVKIRGHRIELAEVELALNKLPNIQQAVVVASNYLSEQAQLIAYLQSNASQDVTGFKEQAASVLPEYMLPTHYVWVKDFAKTSSGKIDKKALPFPKYKRPSSAPLFKKPATDIQKNIAQTWSNILRIPKIGILDNFFEMGGTSLLAQKTVAILRQKYNYNTPIIKLYQHPTISELSNYLEPRKTTKTKSKIAAKRKNPSSDVAVIGMALRFPGANSIEELWEVLRAGKETISFFTPEELDPFIPECLRNDPLYVRARGVVPVAKTFDAAFFGLNPKVAEAMDPQQRLFLEIAWEALEQAGHLPEHYSGNIGVYAGTGTNTYYKNNILPNKDLLARIGDFQTNTVNEKDYVSSRTAYHLNLKGPAVSVQSACSTSLLAIAEAVDAIRNGRCDVALAGGSSVTAPINSGHLYQEGSMLSPDGHCRSFDENAKGTIFSDGAGVVLLKNLEDAKANGDIIYGVIRGVGVNNDGGNKGSFTAPSVEGQAGAIAKALFDARIESAEISYIETHGTATPVGDPIEIEGLKMAFGKQPFKGYCAIGSIKSNMGHLTAAAGVAGVIKTILALKNKKIPASLGYKKANPVIDFENSPFYVNNKLSDWNCNGKRRAGISSFGVGGTNVHIIVEEFETKQTIPEGGKPLQILTWSAKTENSLVAYKTALGNFIKSSTATNLADIAYSLSASRAPFNQRSFVLATDAEHAVSQLLSNDTASVKTSDLKIAPNHLAFLFPGQGAQYLQMGKALYEHEAVFREAVDTCAEILLNTFNFDIRHIIYPENNSIEAESRLKDTQFTQPALFTIEYALSQLWIHWGIQPSLLCGHSIGEFVAAHLAGVFTLNDALILVAVRGKLVSELPRGSMLSIRITLNDLSQMLPETLSVAAVNSDQLCVVSGEDKAVEAFAKTLKEKEIPNMLLLTSHAFHSTMMDPVMDTFETEVEKVTLNTPCVPVISTVTGNWLSDAEATDPKYWAKHLRATVRFSDAMETALEFEDIVLLEVGPGRALTTLSQQKKKTKSVASIASLVVPKDNENSYHTVLTALGQLWQKGIEPDWKSFYENQSRQKVCLPAYVFDRKPCWVDPPAIKTTAVSNISTEFNNHETKQIQMDTVEQPNRITTILEKISDIVLNTSGVEIESSEYNHSFLELGLDSLVLTQMAITCKNEFNTPITFRQLNGEYSTPNLLANYLDESLSSELLATASLADVSNQNGASYGPVSTLNPNTVTQSNGSAIDMIAQQLQLLGQQLELLKENQSKASVVQQPIPQKAKPVANALSETLSEDNMKVHKKPFGASPKIEVKATKINSHQQTFLEKLTFSYNKKTAGSKSYSQKHRSHMADPRVVSGFKPLTKELVYPLVVKKSSGSRLWDIDNNEYLDVLNGFGSCLFGHQPDFITKALHEQIESGYEVGPQHPLAGEVCQLLCEFTGHERAALCNTGSEAVLGAMRIARTVTGRSLIVAFSGAYHGINDESLVRGSKQMKTFPAAAGILSQSVQNILILDYGTAESLDIIRERSHELAAVLVEPVQSRRPELQPIEFLKEVRAITKASETVLIFDEVITGFRMHPGGAQALFDIKADLATYGKVIGGGMPIGAIAGISKHMDALDGGFWQYGDSSFPEVGVTYFAGTFVRHPLALAAANATLTYMKDKGEMLQNKLNLLTQNFAMYLNSAFKKRNLPLEVNYFGSLWRLKFIENIPYSELFFVVMREKGIHIWDGFPCFFTTAHSEEDVRQLQSAFISSIDALISADILKPEPDKNATIKKVSSTETLNKPPVAGARLGMDELGNPAWFVPNADKEGKFIKINL
ncbi:polyketide synthase [Hwangdonia lutea]|uniref:Amino acid adenylation domain-containing protein n=1 Tax=Hwangdonia lutea TaxID=3075823 RepID=A0AA97ENA4_9FLAO|nr:polyketide synthase [Hwangdonia sp. SCSIO 19198]WOD44519.1 amino acid adenylation domain-containing protein [Hwangdonia sp. SCSIO 19198]